MANKQSVPVIAENNRGVAEEMMTTPLPIEQQSVVNDEHHFTEITFGASEYAKYKQKTDEEIAKIKTAAAVGAYRKQLMGVKTMTEFDALAKQNENLLQMVVADDDIGAAFWRKNGDKISELTMRDINKLREAKTFEFGKESLRQMLADTQNVLAMEPLGQGNTLLAKGVEEISKTPFLDETEKATYRNDYLKTGILNLALSDIDEATAAAEKYLPEDEELRAKIARTGELNVIAKQVAKEAEEEAKYAGDVRSALALWQKKERGEVNAAAYYVLAQNNRADVLWGDDDNDGTEQPLTEVYRILQNNRAGMKAEEMRDAGNYLIRAYKQGQISFDEAAELQNQLMNTEGGFDEVFADAAERIFGADEGGEFAEKKARKVLEFFEAYNAEKNAKIAEFTANGGVLTPAITRKFARDAVKTASEDYGFAEDAEKWKNDWVAKSAKSENLFDDENAKQDTGDEYAGMMNDAEVENEDGVDNVVSKISDIKLKLLYLGYYDGDINDLMTSNFNQALSDYSKDHLIDNNEIGQCITQVSKKLNSVQNFARAEFDGQYLRFIENGKVVLEIPAMSGKPDYQEKKYQNVKNKGPIPEGKYRVKQNEVQKIKNTLLERLGRGKAPGGYSAWGKNRVWLEPFSSNEMYERDNLSIHGGKELGSLGCIDLGKNDTLFFDKFKKYGKDIILSVHYSNDKFK